MSEVDTKKRLVEDLASIGVQQPLAAAFLDEVHYAVLPPEHERRLPLYGAMTFTPFERRLRRLRVVQMTLPFPLPKPLDRVWTTQSLEVARQIADGQNTFLEVGGNLEGALLTFEGKPDELALTSLVRDSGLTTVQRSGDGKVRLFLPDFLATHHRNRWRVKPYSGQMYWPLDRIQAPGVGQSILDLAVHVLSASNVGATIFWSQRERWESSPALDRTKAIAIEPMPLTDPRSFAGVRSIAAQNDRAMVVDRDGNLRSIAVALKHPSVPDEAETAGGMRHNSGFKASIEDQDAVVIVCSEDGPVTVFYRGQILASFRSGSWYEECGRCQGSGVVLGEPVVASNGKAYDPVPESCPDCSGSGSFWSAGPILAQANGPASTGRVTERSRRRATPHPRDRSPSLFDPPGR